VSDTFVADRLREGFVFTCATCNRLRQAIAHGSRDCAIVLNGKACGGPVSGQAYPEYKGPLEGHQEKVCFLTGSMDTVAAVQVNGVLLGCSDKAVTFLNEFSAPGRKSARISNVKVPVRT